jgi:hypothetical protein
MSSNEPDELLVDEHEATVGEPPEDAQQHAGDYAEDVLRIPEDQKTKELPTDLAADNEDAIGPLSGPLGEGQ